ncbi:MAG: hypothetical protein ACREFQ_11175 [Stellaceae bacterium]
MRVRAILLGLVCTSIFAPAWAGTVPGFTLGAEAGYYCYRESGLRITGPSAGVTASWTSWPGFAVLPRPLFLRFEGIGNLAYVDYSSEVSGTASGIFDLKGEARALVGGDIAAGTNLTVTPFAGIGYRMLYDLFGGTTTSRGTLGYNRLSQYLYIPVGVSIEIPWDGWTVTPTLEADYLAQGWQTSYIRNLGSDENITNAQPNGYGFRGSLMLGRGPLSFGPYARFWKIGQSEKATVTSGGAPVAIAFEPSNNTYEVGLALMSHF